MSLESFIFFLVLPILAALPFGTSYFSDRKSGFLKNLYMQASRKQYLSAKYTAVFLSGGIAVLVPLLLNLLCSLVLLPNLVPATILTQNGINASCAFYELYFTAPLGYIVLFLLLDFIFGGIFACIALAASFLSDYIVIVTVCPFFVQLVLHVVCTMFSVSECSSVYFTQAGYGIKHLWVVGVYIIVGILATMVIFFHKGEKEDVF